MREDTLGKRWLMSAKPLSIQNRKDLHMDEHAERPPQPTSSMQQFEVLVGEWNMLGTHPALPSAVQGHSSFEWLVAGALLLWRFDWQPDDIPSALSVIGRDDAAETCSLLYADVRGVARIYQMRFEGGVWKMWRDSLGFSQRMTGSFSEDSNTITSHGELSYDGSTWEPDLSVTYTRKA
jgi:hypothetical protein